MEALLLIGRVEGTKIIIKLRTEKISKRLITQLCTGRLKKRKGGEVLLQVGKRWDLSCQCLRTKKTRYTKPKLLTNSTSICLSKRRQLFKKTLKRTSTIKSEIQVESQLIIKMLSLTSKCKNSPFKKELHNYSSSLTPRTNRTTLPTALKLDIKPQSILSCFLNVSLWESRGIIPTPMRILVQSSP